MLVVSRDIAAAHLNRVIVAPATRTVRGIPTEIALSVDEGLEIGCAASFENLGPQPICMFTQRIGHLDASRSRICADLGALADCA